jgi:hypothetical protein
MDINSLIKLKISINMRVYQCLKNRSSLFWLSALSKSSFG